MYYAEPFWLRRSATWLRSCELCSSTSARDSRSMRNSFSNSLKNRCTHMTNNTSSIHLHVCISNALNSFTTQTKRVRGMHTQFWQKRIVNYWQKYVYRHNVQVDIEESGWVRYMYRSCRCSLTTAVLADSALCINDVLSELKCWSWDFNCASFVSN